MQEVLISGFADQVGKEFHDVITEIVGEDVQHSCCVLNLVIEVSVLEAKGYDGVPRYSKRRNYLGRVCQRHHSDLAHDPSSIKIICTMFS